MADRDPAELAERMEREADALERRSQELKRQAQGVRQDWERKRSDSNVPGAVPRETGGEEPEAEFPAKAESREDDQAHDED